MVSGDGSETIRGFYLHRKMQVIELVMSLPKEANAPEIL
jgi:hypothetical protein